jgi:hypothetical protein
VHPPKSRNNMNQPATNTRPIQKGGKTKRTACRYEEVLPNDAPFLPYGFLIKVSGLPQSVFPTIGDGRC